MAAAGMLLFDPTDRFILVEPTYKPYWDIPGGVVEAGETPAQAAARELREELDLELWPGPMLVVDWAPSPEDGDKVLFVFDGGQLTAERIAAIRPCPEEIASVRFTTAAQAAVLLIPRLRRRVLAALGARRRGSTVYLEHGEPVGGAGSDASSPDRPLRLRGGSGSGGSGSTGPDPAGPDPAGQAG